MKYFEEIWTLSMVNKVGEVCVISRVPTVVLESPMGVTVEQDWPKYMPNLGVA
jgi:hypothetical protein